MLRVRSAENQAIKALSSSEYSSATDQYMIEFASRWMRFGGGRSEDIFVEFGVPDRVFFGRLERLVADDHVLLPETTRAELQRVCSMRLQAAI